MIRDGVMERGEQGKWSTEELCGLESGKVRVYTVRPARMRSSFPLLEPGPPRFSWWYENSE